MRDAVENISFINIVSSSEEDSYTIFEILNARGTSLEDYELLKNYIMRYIQPEYNRDNAKKVWGEIEGLVNTNFKNSLSIMQFTNVNIRDAVNQIIKQFKENIKKGYSIFAI